MFQRSNISISCLTRLWICALASKNSCYPLSGQVVPRSLPLDVQRLPRIRLTCLAHVHSIRLLTFSITSVTFVFLLPICLLVCLGMLSLTYFFPYLFVRLLAWFAWLFSATVFAQHVIAGMGVRRGGGARGQSPPEKSNISKNYMENTKWIK